MARLARQIDHSRISELRDLLNDPSYVEGAVERLAGRITERLLGDEQTVEYPAQRSERSSRNDIARLLAEEE